MTLKRQACVLLLLLCHRTCAAEPDDGASLALTLPPVAYAAVGSELGVYFDNLVLSEHPDELSFRVTCDLGTTKSNRWTLMPDEADVGDHPWRVSVIRDGQELASAAMSVHVSPTMVPDAGEVRLLIIGDSLTHATVYPNDLARRLNESGLRNWTMLGTHRPDGAAAGVAHEGYGGWTWHRFLTHYEPNPDPAQRKHSSPFVFLDGDRPKLNVARYVHEACEDRPPDFVIFLLGINDCFGADPHDATKLDRQIDDVFQSAEALLAAFRKAAPRAELAICLTTPGNVRDAAFEQNYGGRYPRSGWQRIQHRLVQREIKRFADREQDRIFIVPTELNLDPVDGYPENNAVHPNEIGYGQIAASIHAWLMSRLTLLPERGP